MRALYLLFIAMFLLSGCVNYKELNRQSGMLSNGTPEQKRLATRHFVKVGAPSVPILTRIIRTSHDQLTVDLAIEALGEIGAPTGAPALLGVIQNKRVKHFPAVKKAIVKIPPTAITPVLVKKLPLYDDPSALCVIEILGTYKDPLVSPSIIPMLKRKDKEVVAASRKALINLAPGSIPFLVSELNDYNQPFRTNLEQILIKIGNPSCDSMLKMLASQETRERESAVRVLGGIKNPDTLSPLVNMLSDPMINIRRTAAKSVAQYGEKAIPLLSDKIRSSADDTIVLKQAALSLGLINSDKTTSMLADMLAGNNVLVREAAAKAMGYYPRTRAIPILKKALMDSDWRVRKAAAESLKKQKWVPDNASDSAFFMAADQDWAGLIKQGESSLKALKITLNDPAGWVRRSALETITAIKVPDDKMLMKIVDDESPKIRSAATLALGREYSPKAEAKLIGLLNDSDKQVRLAAINSLGRIKSKKAVPALIKLLKSEDRNIRIEAVAALSMSGDKSVIPALAEIAEKDHWEIRKKAISGLGGFSTPEATKALVDALDDEDFYNRNLAAELLQKRNWKAKNKYEQCLYYVANADWDHIIDMGTAARPALLVFVNDKNYIVKMLSYEMLAYCGEKGDFPVLRRGLESDPEPKVCEAAGFAIYRLGGKESETLLADVYNKSKIPLVRKICCENLGKFKHPDKKTVDLLINALGDESPKVRMTAATALGRLKATNAVDDLIKIVNTDKDKLPRRAAARALRRIGDKKAMVYLDGLRRKSTDLDVRREASRAFRDRR